MMADSITAISRPRAPVGKKEWKSYKIAVCVYGKRTVHGKSTEYGKRTEYGKIKEYGEITQYLKGKNNSTRTEYGKSTQSLKSKAHGKRTECGKITAHDKNTLREQCTVRLKRMVKLE